MRKVMAAAATLTIVGSVTAAATGAASAATPACGPPCISVFSSELGTYAHPNFVEAVLGGGGANVGQPVGLKQASGTGGDDAAVDAFPVVREGARAALVEQEVDVDVAVIAGRRAGAVVDVGEDVLEVALVQRRGGGRRAGEQARDDHPGNE